MKTFMSKVFLFMCAGIVIVQSVVLFMVGLGRITVREVVSFYNFIAGTQAALHVALGLGGVLLFVGCILFLIALRMKTSEKAIVIKEYGQLLRIPVATLKDFVRQILVQNSYLSDVEISISHKGKWIYLAIHPVFESIVSIPQKILELREALSSQIEQVFEFKNLRINFQVKGIKLNSTKKYFEEYIVEEAKDESVLSLPEETIGVLEEAKLHDESAPEEEEDASQSIKPRRKFPWQR